MKKNDLFDTNRFLITLKAESNRLKKSVLVNLVATVGILFIISLLVSGISNIMLNFNTFFYIGLYIGSFIVAGMAFPDFRKKESTIRYLTLPASVFEKQVSQMLIVFVGYILFYVIAFYLYWILIWGWRHILGLDTTFFNIFDDPDLTKHFITIWFWQSVFFLGSVWFSKSPIIKTVLIIFSVIAFLSLLDLFVITKIFFDNYTAHHGFIHSNFNIEFNSYLYYFLIPLFWVATYFKIKEKQI